MSKDSLNIENDYQKTARNLFKEVDWNQIPVDIEKILQKLDIPFQSKDFSDSERSIKDKDVDAIIQGMVHVEQDNIRIYYNPKYKDKDVTKTKKTFTLAHELAHCILHANEINEKQGFLDLYRTDEEIDINTQEGQREYSANALAGEILMPSDIFITFYEILIEKKSFTDTISSLSRLFAISKTVVKAKIDYLKL